MASAATCIESGGPPTRRSQRQHIYRCLKAALAFSLHAVEEVKEGKQFDSQSMRPTWKYFVHLCLLSLEGQSVCFFGGANATSAYVQASSPFFEDQQHWVSCADGVDATSASVHASSHYVFVFKCLVSHWIFKQYLQRTRI